MKKILLIAGCSNAAGFEIYGDEDTIKNRNSSFGNLLAKKLDRQPVNIAMGGSSNPAIARSVLCWFNHCYTPETMDVAVLVAWTEGLRMDIPYSPKLDYSNPGSDWYTYENQNFLQVNAGLRDEHLNSEKEKRTVKETQNFMMNNIEYLDSVTSNNIIMLQNFFAANKIQYIMCNTLLAFSDENSTTCQIYKNLIDKTYYMDIDDQSKCFYWYYVNLGFENKLAKYWHHGEEPHYLFGEKLYDFWTSKYDT